MARVGLTCDVSIGLLNRYASTAMNANNYNMIAICKSYKDLFDDGRLFYFCCAVLSINEVCKLNVT